MRLNVQQPIRVPVEHHLDVQTSWLQRRSKYYVPGISKSTSKTADVDGILGRP